MNHAKALSVYHFATNIGKIQNNIQVLKMFTNLSLRSILVCRLAIVLFCKASHIRSGTPSLRGHGHFHFAWGTSIGKSLSVWENFEGAYQLSLTSEEVKVKR